MSNQSPSRRSPPSRQRLLFRRYLLSLLLLAVACGLMSVGDTLPQGYGFPWTLVALLAVVAVANLWGGWPAAFVLVLAALFGDIVMPHLHPTSHSHSLPWRFRTVRMLLFLVCGAAIIWLAHRARLMRDRAEQRRVVVEALQRMILPERLERAFGYDLAGYYQPARREEEVGGDFYDFYPLGPDRYGVLLGDVMGKGKEAAAFTALLRYTVRAFASLELPPAQVLRQLNALIERQHVEFGTATVFVGVLDAAEGKIRYASAGHEPPMLCRADGAEETLGATGPIVGIGEEFAYGEREVVLAPGDSLLLMTDGVTEARNADGEFLDADGAWHLLRSALLAPTAERALSRLGGALQAYIGANSRDDIAMLLIRRSRKPFPHIEGADDRQRAGASAPALTALPPR